MYSQHQIDRLNAVAHKYKDVIYSSLRDVLNSPRYRNTGAGVESIHVDVIDGDANKSAEIHVAIADHIFLLDKRRKLQWTKLPNMTEMIAYAETKSFSKIPGYANSIPVDRLKAAQRVAWAIAVDKKKNDTYKAKPWRKKSLSAVLKDLNKEITSEFDKAVSEDLEDATV